MTEDVTADLQQKMFDKAYGAYKEQHAAAERLVLERNKLYQERNCLVAALSKMWEGPGDWRAWLARHPDDPTWEPEWMTIVFFDSPVTGQMSWHIHELELPMFAHLSWGKNEWDGHTTEEKYDRLGKL